MRTTEGIQGSYCHESCTRFSFQNKPVIKTNQYEWFRPSRFLFLRSIPTSKVLLHTTKAADWMAASLRIFSFIHTAKLLQFKRLVGCTTPPPSPSICDASLYTEGCVVYREMRFRCTLNQQNHRFHYNCYAWFTAESCLFCYCYFSHCAHPRTVLITKRIGGCRRCCDK